MFLSCWCSFCSFFLCSVRLVVAFAKGDREQGRPEEVAFRKSLARPPCSKAVGRGDGRDEQWTKNDLNTLSTRQRQGERERPVNPNHEQRERNSLHSQVGAIWPDTRKRPELLAPASEITPSLGLVGTGRQPILAPPL